MSELVSDKKDIQRIKTYIKGLDDNMEGGIPKGHVVLVSGPAGSMKSSVAFNILYNEALHNNKVGLYVSLEQSYISLLNHAVNMEYDLDKINIVIIEDLSKINQDIKKIKENNKGTLVLADIGTIRKEIKGKNIEEGAANKGWLNVIKNLIKKIKLSADLDFFVLDSLSAFYVLSKFENPRIELFHVFEFLRDAELTSYLISEMHGENEKYSEYYVEDFLSDGILFLNLAKFRRQIIREISIVKMRTTKCNNDIFSLEYSDNEFKAKFGGQNPLL